MTSLARRRELAAFLRSRRQRVDPREHDLEPGRRRAPGLRREEVATLAGVSLSWYTWLEQARDIHPSADVLTSLGRALLLNPAELEYLLRLGGFAPAHDPRSGQPGPDADAQLRALTAGFLPFPASVVTPSFDYVAWNKASERIVPGFLGRDGAGTYNLVRFLFRERLDLDRAGRLGDYPRAVVARLRANTARHPADGSIDELVEEVSRSSSDFARLWRLREVELSGLSPNLLVPHPDAGVLAFRQTLLTPEAHPELTLVVFLPADDVTATGLSQLVADDGR